MNESLYYLTLIVGYEGIDVIYEITEDRDLTIRMVEALRDRIRWVNSLEGNDLETLEWPDMRLWLKEPDRVCVMRKIEGYYQCCCGELGVTPKEPILY